MEGKGHVAIDVEEEKHSWMHAMKSRVLKSCEEENFFDSSPIFIPTVGENIRSGMEDYYNPKVVSIGPYHHGSQLHAMDGYKAKCLKDLLDRNYTPLEKCFVEVHKKEAQARKCYKTFEHSVLAFVEIMVVDAGFIIELFMKQSEDRHTSAFYSICPLIKRDLLLLENQLPFSILQCMFDLTITKSQTSPTLHKIAFGFFNPEQERSSLDPPDCVHHLLHLYQSQFIPDRAFRQADPISIPCAKMLHKMGVEFKSASKTSLLTHIKFKKEDKHVVLQIPHLFIDEETIALFTNLVTLEQTHIGFGFGTHFTSYAVFMRCMLSKVGDAEFLCQKGIIKHTANNHEEVVDKFAKMCSGAFIDPKYCSLSAVLRDIKKYSESPDADRQLMIWEARQEEKPWYFLFYKSKFNIALTVAGGLGIWIFTCLQTLYTITAYYHAS